FYDFSNPDQCRDWTYGNTISVSTPATNSRNSQDWKLQNGHMVHSEEAGRIMSWMFPLAEFSVSADIVYQDSSKPLQLQSCLTWSNAKAFQFEKNKVWGFCRDGAAVLGKGLGLSSSFRPFVWRSGETANIRWVYDPGDTYPQQIYVNNQYAISGKEPYTSGGIGFAFSNGKAGGKGSVTNIH